jgi:bifunctional non-homologous end joining protein LigD
VYSVRPQPKATVAAPVTWDEVERGFEVEDFRIDNVPERIARRGDLFAPVQARGKRFRLDRLL